VSDEVRKALIGKLSDCMDPDNAADFVQEAIAEALAAERQAREQAEQELDRLQAALTDIVAICDASGLPNIAAFASAVLSPQGGQ
jgi:non-homologous end joining protein Ku